MALGILVAQNNDAEGDQHEREECADVRHRRKRSHVEEPRRDGDEHAGDPGGEGRCPKTRMDSAEDVRQQAVARHGEPDARLPELKDEDRRDHSDERSDEYCQLDPVQSLSARPERQPS